MPAYLQSTLPTGNNRWAAKRSKSRFSTVLCIVRLTNEGIKWRDIGSTEVSGTIPYETIDLPLQTDKKV
ncbi:hypothetical protein KIPB_001375 [Kipferlia bialata]|uniref:Uncharacterized protein n=1 Tax=Kipferlia bialata TaxID=797122 RepID=A0A9K3CQ62_9EUKA|nr:hypothetical protein KIPB_001375 [Kipferlia bialata]|eukprot:g1375.t1